MRKWIWSLLGVTLLSAGCSNSIAYPDFLHPGSLAYQRYRAEIFDPYPTTNYGTPVEGARPNTFKTSAPEVQTMDGRLINRFGPPPDKYDLRDVN